MPAKRDERESSGHHFDDILIGHRSSDRLIAGPYMNLFSILVEIRVVTWFVIALTSVTWYSSRLASLLRAISAETVQTTDQTEGHRPLPARPSK